MSIEEFMQEWHSPVENVLVHTSGSTGKPKTLWVEKRCMKASARMTCEFLGLKEGDTALLCMPLDYIAGKMMVVRSLVWNLKLVAVEPCGHPLAVDSFECLSTIDFAAMVPLQVYNSMQVPEERERLMQIRHLIIGGGAIDDALAAELRSFPNPVWSTYGMTETLSHIAMRRLNGIDLSEWYTPLPGVSINQTADGCLVIDAPRVCSEQIVTNDVVEIKQKAKDKEQKKKNRCGNLVFRVLGRKDNVICSGGIKVQAEEVERLLKPHLHVPFLITKASDEKFGEVVVLLHEGGDDIQLSQLCCRILPRYWQPRIIRRVTHLLFTKMGKPRRDIRLY